MSGVYHQCTIACAAPNASMFCPQALVNAYKNLDFASYLPSPNPDFAKVHPFASGSLLDWNTVTDLDWANDSSLLSLERDMLDLSDFNMDSLGVQAATTKHLDADQI
jgi:hypothetical protein